MIESQEALEATVEEALAAESVAIDTEFLWERTFYPILALVQIGLPDGEIRLIDTLRLADLSPLGRLLESSATVKVLHDASHDLAILHRETGASACNIFDIQRASGLIGLESTLSLQKLLQSLLGIVLPKTQSRSDWLRRPLTNAQLDYARDDVRYLTPAMDAITSRALTLGREHWLQEEMTGFNDPARYREPDPYNCHLRIGGIRRLGARKREVLSHLAAWREEAARQHNVPRAHVVSDKVLVALAKRSPRTPGELSSLRSLSDRARATYGTAILAAVSEGLSTAEDEIPPLAPAPATDRAHVARVQLLGAYLNGKGLAEGVDPVLIASRAELNLYAMTEREQELPLHGGWRREFIGGDLDRVLRGSLAVRIDPTTWLPGPA